MIDFRYLLTTIVAIFLALAIGLLIGSGLLADELADDLERQVRETIDRNNQLRGEISILKGRIDAEETFGRQIEGRWISGVLEDDAVVLFRFEGTDEGLIEKVRESVELAGGSVPTTITITNRMAMDDQDAVDDLAQDLAEIDLTIDEDLATTIARELGSRASADANGAGDPVFPPLQEILEDHRFIEVDSDQSDPIPLVADFVVAGGAGGAPPYDVVPFAEGLLFGLSEFTSEVVADEGWESEWGFVPEIRKTDVAETVSTVDHGDTSAGAISTVVELSRISANDPGHYGFREGAEGIVPEDLPGG